MSATEPIRGFWGEFRDSCLGGSFLAGVLGNLIASGVEDAGKWALGKLQLQKSDLLDHSACFGNHHLLRALGLAHLESLVATAELTLTQDLGVPYTFWKEELVDKLVTERSPGVHALRKLRRAARDLYNNLEKLPEPDLKDLTALTPQDSSTLLRSSEFAPDAGEAGLRARATQAASAALPRLLERLEVASADLPPEFHARFNEEWFDLYRRAFWEIIKSETHIGTAARHAFQTSVLARLPERMRIGFDDLNRALEAQDRKLEAILAELKALRQIIEFGGSGLSTDAQAAEVSYRDHCEKLRTSLQVWHDAQMAAHGVTHDSLQQAHGKLDTLLQRGGPHSPHRPPFQLPPTATVGRLFGRDALREKLIARLRLQQHVDVWGPAGMGKTALAADAVRAVVGETVDTLAASPFPEGVVLLNLYQLKAKPDLVWGELAALFDPTQPEDRPAWERARAACRGRRALVIVEGAEEANASGPERLALPELLAVIDPQTTRLILTRDEAQTSAPQRLAVTGALEPDDALALLREAAPEVAEDILRGVHDCLGGHPLALTWAGCQLADADEPPGDFLQALRARKLPRLHEPGYQKHTLPWLYERSVRRFDPDTLAVMQVAGQVAHDLFPASLAAAALGGGGAEERGRKALRRLVHEGFLQITADGWQFTHVLPYQFSHELETLDDETGRRLADWAFAEFQRAIAAFKKTYDTAETRRALRHALSLLDGGFLRQNPELLQPLISALPQYSTGLSDVAAQLARALYDRIKAAREAGRPELTPKVAQAAGSLATALSELGRRAEALAPAQEAVELYRALARQNPVAFLPNLATSLGAMSQVLAGMERNAEAAAALAEGIRTLQPQFMRLPEAFAPLIGALVQLYLQAAQAAQVEPDMEWLAPIVELLQRFQDGKPGAGQ